MNPYWKEKVFNSAYRCIGHEGRNSQMKFFPWNEKDRVPLRSFPEVASSGFTLLSGKRDREVREE